MKPPAPHPTQLEALKMPPAMRAALQQLDALAVDELHAHKALRITMHRDAVAMLRFGARALALLSAEVVHHLPDERTGRMLDLLADAAIALRDAYRARLNKAKQKEAA